MTSSQPRRCPICRHQGHFAAKPVRIASGLIYICNSCEGYFLYPPQQVEYTDSPWTDRRRDNWDGDVSRGRPFANAIRNAASALLSRNVETVLEIGCGSAFMGIPFQEVGCAYTGLDVDNSSVELARAKGLDVHCIAGEDLHRSPLGQRSYDLVLSSNTLEHVQDPVMVFENIRKVVNGLAVIIVPNAEGLLPRMKANQAFLKLVQGYWRHNRVIAYTIDGYWHNIAYSRNTLTHLCKQSGLAVRELRSISINDATFGFVQPNNSPVYRGLSWITRRLDVESQLILIAQQPT
jgi:SAM-dependent methyltransferase